MSAESSHRRIVLIGFASLAIAMGIGRFAFTPLLPLMQQDGLLSIADGGLLAALHFLGYWLGAVFAARLPTSPRATLRLSLIALGLCTLGMGLTDSLPVWLVLRWLAGACSAFTLVMVGNFYLKHLAGSGSAAKHGWIFSGVGAGIAIAGFGTLALMILHVDSARSWQIFGIASLAAAAIVCLRMGPELPDTRVAARHRSAPRIPLVWRVVIAYGAAGAGYIIPATYLPAMARAIVPSPLVFGWTWPVFGLAAFVSTLVAAKLQRRFTNRHLWVASQLIMATGLLLPVLSSHIAAIIVAGICVGGTFMIVTMAGMQEAHRIAPTADGIRHIAVMTAAFATGQMAGPVVAGALHSLTGSFDAALVLTSVLLVATAVPLIRCRAKSEVVCP